MFQAAPATAPVSSLIRDKQYKQLEFSDFTKIQIDDVLKITKGRDFKIVPFPEKDLSDLQAVFTNLKSIASEEGLCVAKIGNLYVVADKNSSVKSLSKAYRAELKEITDFGNRETRLANAQIVAYMYSNLSAEDKAGIDSTDPAKVAFKADARKLANALGGLDQVDAWASRPSIERNVLVPGLYSNYSDSYSGDHSLRSLTEAAKEIISKRMGEEAVRSLQKSEQLWSNITGPAARVAAIAVLAVWGAFEAGFMRGGNPTAPANEKDVVPLVEQGYRNGFNPHEAVKVKLDTYGDGQIADVHIYRVEKTSFEGADAYTASMVLISNAGVSSFDVLVSAKSQGSFDGYVTVGNIAGPNKNNPEVCSEAANLAFRQLMLLD